MRALLLSSVCLPVALITGTTGAQAQTQTTPDAHSGATATGSQPDTAQNGQAAAPSSDPGMSSANAAQSTGVSPATPQISQSGLQDIIVTAQRREENLQRAAVSVNVARGADLIAAGITEPYRLSELSPGLTIQPTGTGNLVFVRGVGNLTTTPSGDPAIAFNYDGVYIGRPASTNGLFFDLDRIRGAQRPAGNALRPQCHRRRD